MSEKVRVDQRGGFTLIELMAATTLLVMAVMAVMAVVVPVSRQREQVEAKNRVLARAKSLIEQIKGVDPSTVFSGFNNTLYDVPGVDGTYTGGMEILCTVDDTVPTLVVVTVTGSWNLLDHTETLELVTEIYSPNGQS